MKREKWEKKDLVFALGDKTVQPIRKPGKKGLIVWRCVIGDEVTYHADLWSAKAYAEGH